MEMHFLCQCQFINVSLSFGWYDFIQLQFLSIKVLFWCCGFIYCLVPLLFSAIFLLLATIIDLVPYKWYQSFFLSIKLWVIFFRVETYFDVLKL
jgi:hypothetical protein